jgi:glycosyltransferase involved in cell wall biosynthesis
MNNILVSVVVPIYNSESFLDKCIQSIINQSYKNLEIILVNDGSTDTSKTICDRYADIDNRIKVINKSNNGLVSSRKTGLKSSTGDYILYIDGDDWIELELVKDYVDQIIKYKADVVVSSHIVNLEGRIDKCKNYFLPGVYNKTKLKSIIYPKMLYTGKFSQFGIFSYSWGKLYRRELLFENQLRVDEDITIGEDALCLYPTLLDADVLVILDQPYYHYRQRADSLIKSLRTIDISKMQKVYSSLKNIFSNKGVLDIMIPQLQYYLLSLLIINTEGPNIDNITELYPFNKIESKKGIVIYGGGTFGQHIYKKIINNKSHNILAWIDEKYEHYLKLDLPIKGFDKIKFIDYDAIIIALIDEDNSNQAVSKLLKYGVDKNKIIQIPVYNITTPQILLSQFKINL